MSRWSRLKSKKDYSKALARIDELIDASENQVNHNELMLLSYLVEEYEQDIYPMPDASPLEVIRFMMEMKGIQQKDLIPVLGTKGYVSKILSGAAKLKLEMIEPLSKFLGIPVGALIPRSDELIGVVAGYADAPVKRTLKVPVSSSKSSRTQVVREGSRRYGTVASKGRKK